MTAVNGGEREISFQRPGSLSMEKLRVKIPKGVSDGQKIRLKGKGGSAPGGQSGDLYLVVNVASHPLFRREGNDIYVDVPVTLYEAALGAKISVPTLEGKALVTVPKNTQSGKSLRLKGKGITAKDGTKGDQYVKVKIVIPDNLSEESLELIKKFREVSPYDPRKDFR
jgi:DnaJ-class molecular chaperone